MIAAVIEQPLPTSRRVLVVDDERALLMLVADALEDDGHEVRTAATGEQALALIETWVPDLILLDLTLPEMSGQEFRERQLALPSPYCDIPVIVVTGQHQQRGAMEGLGAMGLLTKPFDLDALVAIVNEYDPDEDAVG